MARLHVWFGLMLLVSAPVLAQQAGRPNASATVERRDQLARDLEGLSDGDPLMRVAVMESMLQRGDASGTYLAMRTGFASDDPALRNLAMRAWVANIKRLTLNVLLPSDLQKQVDASLLDPKQASDVLKKGTWLYDWSVRSFSLALAFTGINLEKNVGKIWTLPNFAEANAVDFSITGVELYATVQVDFPGVGAAPCHLRLAPTSSLNLEGYVACDFAQPSPQLKITGPMF